MKLFTILEDYLKKDSGKSSLRLNVTTMVQTANVSFILLVVCICYKLLRGTLTDSTGLSLILAAITAYAVSALWGKNKGKEKEDKNE